MPVAVNDILAVTYRYLVKSQVCLADLKYRVTSAPATGTVFQNSVQLAQKMADVAGTVLPKLLACLADEVTVNAVRVQRIYPSREVYAEETVAQAGTNTIGVSAEPCTHYPFEKRTAKAGRRGVGSLHLSGIPAAQKSGNLWIAIGTEFTDLATALVQQIVMVTPAWTVTPCLLNRTDPGTKFADLIEVLPLAEIRTSNRRVVGRGI